MKKQLIVLPILISLMFCFCLSTYANYIEDDPLTPEEQNALRIKLQDLRDKEVLPATVVGYDGRTYPFILEQSVLSGYPFYGVDTTPYNPINTIPLGTPFTGYIGVQQYNSGHYRYLGYDLNGAPIYNPAYPIDTSRKSVIWQMESKWVKAGTFNPTPVYDDPIYWGDTGIAATADANGNYRADFYFSSKPPSIPTKVQTVKASFKEVLALELKNSKDNPSHFYPHTITDPADSNADNYGGTSLGFNEDDMRWAYSVISLRTEYTPFFAVGQKNNGYYQTFYLSPYNKESGLDLEAKLMRIDCTGLTGCSDSGQATVTFPTPEAPVTYDTYVNVKLKSGTLPNEAKTTKPVVVAFYVSSENSEGVMAPNAPLFEILTPEQITKLNGGEEIEVGPFKWDYPGEGKDVVHLKAVVNPEIYDLTRVIDYLISKGYPATTVSIGEPNHDNNQVEKIVRYSVTDDGGGPGTIIDKITYEYNPVYSGNLKMQVIINPDSELKKHRLFTYEPNRIYMVTSTDVSKVRINFGQGKCKVDLRRDAAKGEIVTGDADWIYEDSLTVTKALVHAVSQKGSATDKTVSTLEEKSVWVYDFKMKNYGIYGKPNANDPLFDIVSFTEFDQNGVSGTDEDTSPLSRYGDIKYRFEVNPVNYYVNVRQTKAFNFRMSDVKDIYWKGVFSDSDGEARKALNNGKPIENPPYYTNSMPLMRNPVNKRLISMGYMTQFKIDTEGARSGCKIKITPHAYYKKADGTFEKAYLYYDDPANGVYNKPYNLSAILLDGTKQTYNVKDAKGNLIVKSNREGWEFTGNKVNENWGDRFYKRYATYRNTWMFSFSMHPKTKAYKQALDLNPNHSYSANSPNNAKKLTGALYVTFDVGLINDNDSTTYPYVDMETNWVPANTKHMMFTINLDWDATKDYTTQQKW